MKGWEIVIEIKRVLSEGLDVSEVARGLKVERKTVRKYRDLDMEGVAAARRRGARRSRNVSQFPPGILREACRRVLRHGCARLGNLKKAALHLRELGAVPEAASPDAGAVAPLPQNIGVEARPCAYCDHAALEEETLP